MLYSSHYGWSNSLTPFFWTVAVTCLLIGVDRRRRAALVAGGAFAGLAIQTHPLTLLACAGAGGWLLSQRRRRHPLTWSEIATPVIWCVAAYAPMLLANVLRPAISLRLALHRTYVVAPTVHPGEYLQRIASLMWMLGDMLAGGLALERFPAPTIALGAALAALVVALMADWRGGRGLVAWSAGSTIALMPLGVMLFLPRYLTFLLPMCFVAVAAAAAEGIGSVAARRPDVLRRTWRVWSLGAVACVLLGTLIWSESRLLANYERWALTTGLSNEEYFRVRDELVSLHACGPRLVVEQSDPSLTDPAWVGLHAVDYVLVLSGCDHARLRAGDHGDPFGADGEGWAVLSVASVPRLAARWHLRPVFLFGGPAGFDRVPLGLYRVNRTDPVRDPS